MAKPWLLMKLIRKAEWHKINKKMYLLGKRRNWILNWVNK